MDIFEKMKEVGIIPVVVLEHPEDAVPTAQALLKGGISVMEITLRTDAALAAIRQVSEKCPEMIVGAGTIKNQRQCDAAIKAGAKFIVSPGLSGEVVICCQNHQIPCVPGCVTPTEIMEALDLGIRIVKFFPANVYGGISAMKALSAPFGEIAFIPTGGVNAENVGEYLKQPFIHAVGGSWICTKKDITEGNFEKITQLCLQARAQRQNGGEMR